jgi:hypothetical protein
MARQANPSQGKAMQAIQGKAWQANARKDKKDKPRHGKEGKGKGMKVIARQCKEREGKASQD